MHSNRILSRPVTVGLFVVTLFFSLAACKDEVINLIGTRWSGGYSNTLPIGGQNASMKVELQVYFEDKYNATVYSVYNLQSETTQVVNRRDTVACTYTFDGERGSITAPAAAFLPQSDSTNTNTNIAFTFDADGYLLFEQQGIRLVLKQI